MGAVERAEEAVRNWRQAPGVGGRRRWARELSQALADMGLDAGQQVSACILLGQGAPLSLAVTVSRALRG